MLTYILLNQNKKLRTTEQLSIMCEAAVFPLLWQTTQPQMDITCYSRKCPEGGSSANRFVAHCCYSALREHQQMQTLAFRQSVEGRATSPTHGANTSTEQTELGERAAEYAHIRTGTGAAERQ